MALAVETPSGAESSVKLSRGSCPIDPVLPSVLSRNDLDPKCTAPAEVLDMLSLGLHKVLVVNVESVVVVVIVFLIGVYPQVQSVLASDTRLPTGILSSLSVGTYRTPPLRCFLKRLEQKFIDRSGNEGQLPAVRGQKELEKLLMLLELLSKSPDCVLVFGPIETLEENATVAPRFQPLASPVVW